MRERTVDAWSADNSYADYEVTRAFRSLSLDICLPIDAIAYKALDLKIWIALLPLSASMLPCLLPLPTAAPPNSLYHLWDPWGSSPVSSGVARRRLGFPPSSFRSRSRSPRSFLRFECFECSIHSISPLSSLNAWIVRLLFFLDR